MWCYRRFGHNEGDEPSFTQPLMYEAISKHPPISQIYGQRLIAEGVVDQAWIDENTSRIHRIPRKRVRGGGELPAQQGRLVRGPLGRARPPGRAGRRAAQRQHRHLSDEQYARLSRLLTTVPDGPHHPQDARPHPRGEEEDARRAARASTGRPPRRWPSAAWSRTAIGVRLSGQDSGRGTFSQRHAVWVDQKTRRKIYPAAHHRARRPAALFEVRDSPLSEFGVLGFEYGYSIADPRDAGAVGGAVRRFRQWRADDHRPVHRRGRSQVAARRRAWSCCCRTASRGRGRSIARPGWSATCSSAPRIISRSPTAPRRPIISTSCAARCCAISASR